MNSFTSLIEGIEHVVWDWNGTLLNDLDHTLNVLNSVLAPYLEERTIDKATHLEHFQFPISAYYEALGIPMKSEEFQQTAKHFIQLYMSDIASCPLHQDSKIWLEQVKEAGISQSILSAMDQENLRKLVELKGVTSSMQNIYGIDNQLGDSKMKRGTELLEVLHCQPDKVLFVGDTDHDHEVATNLGFKVALVTHGHQSEQRLSRLNAPLLSSPI